MRHLTDRLRGFHELHIKYCWTIFFAVTSLGLANCAWGDINLGHDRPINYKRGIAANDGAVATLMDPISPLEPYVININSWRDGSLIGMVNLASGMVTGAYSSSATLVAGEQDFTALVCSGDGAAIYVIEDGDGGWEVVRSIALDSTYYCGDIVVSRNWIVAKKQSDELGTRLEVVNKRTDDTRPSGGRNLIFPEPVDPPHQPHRLKRAIAIDNDSIYVISGSHLYQGSIDSKEASVVMSKLYSWVSETNRESFDSIWVRGGIVVLANSGFNLGDGGGFTGRRIGIFKRDESGFTKLPLPPEVEAWNGTGGDYFYTSMSRESVVIENNGFLFKIRVPNEGPLKLMKCSPEKRRLCGSMAGDSFCQLEIADLWQAAKNLKITRRCP